MGGKNYGPIVSGYLDPTGRNWEDVIFQKGKAVLDKELNLGQDIDVGAAEVDRVRAMPSGWISNDFLNSSAQVPFFVSNATSLTLQVAQGLLAHVNGWLINVEHTGVINTNTLTLTAGPAAEGRTDLVILEVWRLLLSPSIDAGSGIGKSVTGRIWQQGNVKTDPANDVALNFPDDILDATIAVETTKRVQIQYRLRVIPGIDIFANPYGMNDPVVFANSVPTGPSLVQADGTPTTYTYANQSPNDDEGLWLAGDGNPANPLGTVDGYIYALPLCAVFRRNTTAWNRTANQNGGGATPGPSGRPDGYFNDVFVARDIADLRTGVSPTGWNFTEVLTKNFQFLLDNNLQTDWTTNPNAGGGISGPIIPWADEIGPFPSDGAGPLIGNFDAVRRTFSSRSILETVTVEIAAPGGGWTNGSTITISPSALNIYPLGALNWAASAPANVVIQDFQDAWWIGATTGKKTVNAIQYIESVTNIGVIPAASLVVTFGALTTLGLSDENLFIDLVIAYPTAAGLSKTPVNTYGANSFVVTSAGGTTPLLAAPYNFSAFANQEISETWREVQLEYTTTNLTITQAGNTDSGTTASITAFATPTATITGLTGMYPALVGQSLFISGAASGGNNSGATGFTITAFISQTSVQISNAAAVAPDANNGAIHWNVITNFFRLPERAATIVSVSKNGGSVVSPGAVLDTTGRIGSLNLTPTYPTSTTVPGDTLTIIYTAIRPMPQNNAGNLLQMTLYYDTAAPQAARQAILSTPFQVTPKVVSDGLFLLTTGAGSQDEGYPWPQGYVQTGGIYFDGSYAGESDLAGRAAIAVTDFNASTGFLRLSTFVPMVANPDQLSFTGLNTDAEGRSYFNALPGGAYIPNAYAQDLSNPNRHKNLLPMLCELSTDSSLGFKGQLVLVLLIRYALFDSQNSVNFVSDETVNTTVASVFRIRGNLLNKRAT